MDKYKMLDTRLLVAIARCNGYTMKQLAEITQININTLYHYANGTNITREKEEKIRSRLLKELLQ